MPEPTCSNCFFYGLLDVRPGKGLEWVCFRESSVWHYLPRPAFFGGQCIDHPTNERLLAALEQEQHGKL